MLRFVGWLVVASSFLLVGCEEPGGAVPDAGADASSHPDGATGDDDGGDGSTDPDDAGVDASAPDADASAPDAGPHSGLGITPAIHDFGDVSTWDLSEPEVFTVTNHGDDAIGPLTVAILDDPSGHYATWGVDECVNARLGPGDSCSIELVFGPIESGRFQARLAIGDASGVVASADLVATAYDIGYLVITSAVPPFAPLDVGAIGPEVRITVENPGDRAVTEVESFVSGDFSSFRITSDDCSPTVGPHATCELGIRFEPQMPGPLAATLVVASDDWERDTIDLRGAGLTDETRTVTITVDPIEGASGTVVSSTSPGGVTELECHGSCTHAFMRGSVVKV